MHRSEYCIRVLKGRVVWIKKTIYSVDDGNGNPRIFGAVIVQRLSNGVFVFSHEFSNCSSFSFGALENILSANFRPEVAEVYKKVFSLDNPTPITIMIAGIKDCEVEYLDF